MPSLEMKTLASLIVVLALLLPGIARSGEPAASDCFFRHLQDAVVLNRARFPLYSKLTGRGSEKLSQRLMMMEQLATPVARYFDWRARRYQKAGIPLLCDDFIDMSETPEFSPAYDGPAPRLEEFRPEDFRTTRRALKRASREGGFEGLKTAALRELERLQGTPEFHCMSRHILESIARAAALAPRYVEDARSLGMKSPAGISRQFIDLQLFYLKEAAELDAMAAPIQASGVPILCQDVPPIPVPGETH